MKRSYLQMCIRDRTPAELGVSGELKVGEKAIAIGNPGGLIYAGSVSEGIISGLNRSLRAANDGYTMNFIQTDAAISPGNSGGALVNEFGQVVGINSQKLSANGYEGIGFAIPCLLYTSSGLFGDNQSCSNNN